MATRGRTVIIEADSVEIAKSSLSSAATSTKKYFEFIGDGTTGDITVPEYVEGTTSLVVDGQRWMPKTTQTPNYYWYEEAKDASAKWTIIRPRYAINQGSVCFVEYEPA